MEPRIVKNIYVLPTDKPSRLFNCFGKLDIGCYVTTRENLQVTNQHIYITSTESISKSDYCLYNKNHNSKNPDWELIKCGGIEREEMHPISEGRLLLWMVKIVLTNDIDLIADGVQAIPDEFLKWFVKNPGCEWVEVRKEKYSERFNNDKSPIGNPDTWGNRWVLVLPNEESKQQTAVEWLIENYLPLKRGIEVEHEKTLKIVNQAKEMEKQQIVDAFWSGDNTDCLSEQNAKEFAEQYYIETYGKRSSTHCGEGVILQENEVGPRTGGSLI